MAVAYFDSSALVKLLVDEEGSDLAATLWDGADAVVASRLAHPEVRAALAAAHRNHRISDIDHAELIERWGAMWDGVRAVELTAAVEGRAAQLASEHALSGADAVHLASALTVPSVLIAVWDRRLHAGAVEVGLSVAPADLTR